MARRKKGQAVNGWVVLDKPSGLGSTKAVSQVRRIFDAQKAGHAGTLDPLASGLLPIALGEATKAIPFVQDGRKIYQFCVRWGQATDTDDAEGNVTETSDHRPGLKEIEAILPQFTGTVSQIPPAYSALKINGVRAYDLARQGRDVPLKPRLVQIDHLKLLDSTDFETCIFEARCGKGTYIRALARDMACCLGTKGHVTWLKRLQVGPFCEEMMIPLDILQEMGHIDGAELASALHPVMAALDDIPALAICDADAARLYQGQAVLLTGKDAPIFLPNACATVHDTLVAIGRVEAGHFFPKRVFKL